ncbi:MAG: dipicolinate synthase subunit B [Oscillospiraceae bacterium]|nr:dipicolinate synthase subunit B [Oscillospiraceae bacterium]
MKKVTVGFAMCGSFCTFSKAIEQMKKLAEEYHIVPIMSKNAYTIDTRFGKAQDFISEVEEITKEKIIHTIEGAEPLGPQKICDLLLIAPCTGNTLAKLSLGITDSPVTMAAKSHLRIQRPVLLSVATNDGLGASAQNIGRLLNTKNVYFVPMTQDDYVKKPNSLVSKFQLIPYCVELALKGQQPQPVFG